MELFISLLFSTLGAAYFLYGKKQSEITFMLAGGLLAFYPYVIPDLLPMILIGIVLAAAPFVAQRYGW